MPERDNRNAPGRELSVLADLLLGVCLGCVCHHECIWACRSEQDPSPVRVMGCGAVSWPGTDCVFFLGPGGLMCACMCVHPLAVSCCYQGCVWQCILCSWGGQAPFFCPGVFKAQEWLGKPRVRGCPLHWLCPSPILRAC